MRVRSSTQQALLFSSTPPRRCSRRRGRGHEHLRRCGRPAVALPRLFPTLRAAKSDLNTCRCDVALRDHLGCSSCPYLHWQSNHQDAASRADGDGILHTQRNELASRALPVDPATERGNGTGQALQAFLGPPALGDQSPVISPRLSVRKSISARTLAGSCSREG